MLILGPIQSLSEPAPPQANFNVSDGIEAGQNKTHLNGTMTGMFAFPVSGGNFWQVVNYAADQQGIRIISSKKVSVSDFLGKGLHTLENEIQQSSTSGTGKTTNLDDGNDTQERISIIQALDPIQFHSVKDFSNNNHSQDSTSVNSKTTRSLASDSLFTAQRYCGFSPKVNLPIPVTSTALPGQYPWSAAILSSDGVFQCAGTLISESIILTTATCILNYRKTNQPLKVVIGAYSLPKKNNDVIPQLEAYVKSAVIHPLYKPDASPQNLKNNIGLLRLMNNVDFDFYPWIFPVCIVGPSLEEQAGTNNCQLVGWPNVYATGGKVAALHTVNVTISQSGCTGGYTNCVNAPTCNGNEGSEVICLAVNSQRYYQWGVVAVQPQCSTNNANFQIPTVNIVENYDFINKYLWTPNPN
jgi:V8-like Glu-specific endopeptidase